MITSPRIRGISLPNSSDLINIQFANDTALFLELSQQNMDSLVSKIRLFGEASGAKISQSKSALLGWKDEPSD